MQALSRGKVRWWICYVIVSAAGMYTHVFMGLALAAQFLWVVVYQRQHLLPIMCQRLRGGSAFPTVGAFSSRG